MIRSQRYTIGPATVFTIGLWTAQMAAAPALMMGDPGMFWHTVVGEQMLQTGAVVTTDTFSFTRGGDPWLAQQWLGELGMALAHRVGALDGVITLAVSAIVLIYSFVFFLAWRSGLPIAIGVLLTILTIAASSYHFLPRPHLFTIVGMLVLMRALQKLDAHPTNRRLLLLLPILFLVWINTHGGALGGIATLTIYCALWLFQPYIPWLRTRQPVGTQRNKTMMLLTIILGLVLVTPLINPFGVALPRTWIALMGSDVLPNVIIEHAPLDLLAPEGFMVLTLAGIYLYTLKGAWNQQRRVSWLLPAIWLLLACSRVRHGPLFAITAALAIIDMWQFHPALKARFTETSKQASTTRSSSSSVATLVPIGALTALALACQALNLPAPLIGANRCRPQAPTWPVAALPALRELESNQSEPIRLFNEMRYAGFLIYEVPNAAVYIDDRCELHRDVGLRRYLELYAHPERLIGEIDRFQINAALVKTDSPFADAFRNLSGWQEFFADSNSTLFSNANGPTPNNHYCDGRVLTHKTGNSPRLPYKPPFR